MIEYHVPCVKCGRIFISNGARGNFCSVNCAYEFYVVREKGNKCWVWSGHLNSNGYGVIHVSLHKPRAVLAHRYSWEIHNGPIPDGLFVLHDCPTGDNPSCVNPAHLWVGTQADNVKDRDDKGRRQPLKGVDHGMAFLTEQDVRDIRKMVASKTVKKAVLEKKYGFSSGYAKKIADRIVWKHIT